MLLWLPFAQVKEVKWLPFPLPPTLSVIASCAPTDAAYGILCDRPDVQTVFLTGLDDVSSRRDVLLRNGEINGNAFDMRGVSSAAVEACMGHRPLFLALMGGEMRMYLDTDRAKASLILNSSSTTFCDAWRNIIKRWTDEYSWTVKDSDKHADSGQGQRSNERQSVVPL